MAGGMEGLDKLMRKLDALGAQVAGETLEKAVNASTKRVQAEARLLCPVDTGELRQSIRTSIEARGDTVTGTVYTNKAYAAYVEFGTGPVGEAHHEGISPNVHPVYSQTGWIILRQDIGAGDKVGYTEGQPAQPYLYPALKNNEDSVTRNIANYISRAIKEAAK